MNKAADAFEEIIALASDNGAAISFRGRMFSESAYFDDETSTLTRLRLFSCEDGSHVYSIVSGAGAQKSRRHYIVSRSGEMCQVSDGRHTISMPIEMLFASVFGLCGIDPARAEELRPSIEEALRASGE